jgi:AP2 domain
MPKIHVKRHAVTQPLDTSYKIIALTKGQNTLVDAADFPWLDNFNWVAHWDERGHKFYAKRNKTINGRQYTVEMASEILQCKPGEQPDHRNGNPLDNRRRNLRKATGPQNKQNRKIFSNNKSGFKGVYWHKTHKKWVAVIGYKGKIINLGDFNSDKEAARARDKMAKKLHGEFAVLNFPHINSKVPKPPRNDFPIS